MKLIGFLSLICFIINTEGYIPVPTQDLDCFPNNGIIRSMQTEFLDLDEDSDQQLKTCLLKHFNDGISLHLKSGNYTRKQAKPARYSVTDHPSVIVMTKQLTSSVLELPSFKDAVKSFRSLLLIIMTDNKRFECKDGALSSADFFELQTFMNKIWHKYRISYVGVTFPLTCDTKIAVYSGKNITNAALYDRNIKIRDMTKDLPTSLGRNKALLTEDYPLKGNMFDRFPTSIIHCEKLRYYTNVNLSLTNGYCGLDALLMHDIITYFKFKMYFPKDEMCSKYGYSTGSNITGSLGCIVRNELDISFNSRFMTKYTEHNIYFLDFVSVDALCVLLKQADVIPLWYYPIIMYSNYQMCILILTLTGIVGVFMWLKAFIKSKLTGNKTHSLFFYILDAYTSTMMGFSHSKNELCLIRGICMFCSLIIVAMLQGHINHLFTTLVRYDSIETLDQLYRSNNILYVTSSMKELLKQLENPQNKEQSDFLHRSREIQYDYKLNMVFHQPNAALLCRKRDAIIEIVSEYKEFENEKALINIVEQCFNTYYLSFIARSGFPFVEEMQRFMERIREVGLTLAYYKWTSNMLGVPTTIPKTRSEPRAFSQMKLEEQRIAFGFLLTGHIVSLIVFFVELWVGKRQKQRIAAKRGSNDKGFIITNRSLNSNT